MKVVVTGGAGFIGSHLVDSLVALGNEVHVIDNFSSSSYVHEHQLVTVHNLDIRSEEAKQLIINVKPEIVFHLAAQADVTRSIQDPAFDADVNIRGTINMLEASRLANVRKIIFSSTSAVYGNLQKEIITENDPTLTFSYYGLSKLSAEKYIELYEKLYGLSYTILRYGNVYGPRQTAKGEGGVIAVFMDKISKSSALKIHGDGEQTRDFVYVKDVVAANLSAAEHGDGETIHVSTQKNTSINMLVDILTKLHPHSIKTVYSSARMGDIKHSCLDNTKANNLLEWHPIYDITTGLKETYEYYHSK